MIEKMEKKKPVQIKWTKIFSYYYKYSKKYRVFFFLTLIGYGGGVVLTSALVPYIYKSIVDIISTPEILSSDRVLLQTELFKYIFYVIGALLGTRLFFILGDYSITYFQNKVLRDLNNFTFEVILQHSYQFFINSFTGSLVKKAGRFVNSFEDIGDIFVYNIFVSFIKITSVFGVLFYVEPILGLIFLGWSFVFILVSYFLARRKIKYDLVEAEMDSKLTARASDVFTNALNLKMFSSIMREIFAFNTVATNQMIARQKAWNYQNFVYILQGALVMWLQVFSLYAVVVLWLDGIVSVGTIILVIAYTDTILESIWHLGKQLTRLSKSFSNASEMVEIIEIPNEITDPQDPEKLKIKKGYVFFENVSFAYNQGNKIFSEFNMEIAPGEKVGIVGTSGAGKSTITKLMLRFADVTEGAIKIDGQDIRNITQDDLRSVISYVPQDPILFHRSLSENISYGKINAETKEIVSASKKAHADDFTSRLPHKYETMVGERGVKLSGGERQRVALARAILKNAPILILDEATSSLDSESESYIQESLDLLMKGKTTIVIAHRLSTIQKMDRIIVLENGEIIEEGNHNFLLEKKGRYAKLWEHQSGGFLE